MFLINIIIFLIYRYSYTLGNLTNFISIILLLVFSITTFSKINKSLSLIKNKFKWNKYFNLLFIIVIISPIYLPYLLGLNIIEQISLYILTITICGIVYYLEKDFCLSVFEHYIPKFIYRKVKVLLKRV